MRNPRARSPNKRLNEQYQGSAFRKEINPLFDFVYNELFRGKNVEDALNA
jgi:hypothetical protein